MSVIVSIVSVIKFLIGMQNIKLSKTLKIENKQNTKQIMQRFTERWDQAEKLIKTSLKKMKCQYQKKHQLLVEFLLSQ